MKKLNWLFLLLFSFAFIACDDDDDDVDLDATAPTITVISPVANTTYAPGDVVPVRADIEDNLGLDEVRVVLMRPDGTETVLNDDSIRDFLNDNTEAEVDFDVNLDANQPVGAYMLRFEAVDEQDNTAQETVTFSVAM